MPTSSHFRTAHTLPFCTGVLMLAALPGCSPEPRESSTPPTTNAPLPSANAAAAETEYRRLLGRWNRADGDYVLDLKNIDASGRLEAAYLNPQPIHVARAEASREGGKTLVFVELQDVNYPGCTYRLTYFPATDQLYGSYYQAALKESYDVEFARDK